MFKGSVDQSHPTYNHSYQSHHSQVPEVETLSRSFQNKKFGTAAGKNSHNSLGILFFLFMCWHS